MCRKLAFLTMITVALVAAPSTPAHAQWVQTGLPVYTGDLVIQGAAMVADGFGGAYFAWWDENGDSQVNVIRIDPGGNFIWPDAITVTLTAYAQTQPDLVSDASGGVFVVWADERGGDKDIYAQRLDGDGNRLWAADGEPVDTTTANQYAPLVVHDGFNNIVIVWEDDTYGADVDLYAQRLDPSGNKVWGPLSAVLVTAASNAQHNVRVIPDGLGGVMMVWEDLRGTSRDIYGERINASGNRVWSIHGMEVCTAADIQYDPELVADGWGGAIVVWSDRRSGGQHDIYAQRLRVQGGVDWASDGVSITSTADNEYSATLAADGTGGAVIAWDRTFGGDSDVYANRIDGNGYSLWASGGIPVCTASDYQASPQIASSGEGTYIIAWADWRQGLNSDIYAQAMDIHGSMLWVNNGMPVCTATDDQDFSYLTERGRPIVDDYTGGVIVTWLDQRNSSLHDIFTQRIEGRYGEWGRPEPALFEVADSPNDQGGNVVVRWTRSDRDKYPQNLITHYSVWRAVEPPEEPPAGIAGGSGSPIVKSPGEVAEDFDGKAIWVETRAGAQQFWEWVGNQNAQWQSGYSYTTATRCDSTAGDPCEHYFKVMAHTTDQFKFWESGPMNGHSLDNLAPAPPLMLAANRVGNYVRLDWNPSGENEPDFADYAVYRGTSAGVDPVPVNFLSSSTDTTLWDQNAPPGTSYYYVVTAKDVHANQSAPSNEVYVDGTTGASDAPALTSLQVLTNVPNPFNGSTEFRIGLPSAGGVSIEIYDVAGRLVATRSAALGEGWQSVSFDGRDDRGEKLSSGVYFYRVVSLGSVVTKKMILMR